ncbi:branched-chain amino acid ABC transporter permease [Natrialbaceae archaeon A-CW3]
MTNDTSDTGSEGGDGRSTRDRIEALPRWKSDLLLIIATLLGVYALIGTLGLITGFGFSGVTRTLRTVTFLSAAYILLVLALNLHWGYTGLFNIGVAGFMAVGAYTMAIATAPVDPGATGTPGLGLPIPVGILLGMAVSGLVGLVVVLPALRIRADYFAIVTLAFAEVIRLLITSGTLREFTVLGRELGTGGGAGINFARLDSVIPSWVLYRGGDIENGTNILGYQLLTITNALGLERTMVENWIYTMAMILLVALVFWLLVRTGNSPFGRVLKAIREDELAAKSLGKNTNAVKIKVFVLGCAIMGLAGIFWQGRNGYVDPNAFMPIVTFYIFIALIIGGAGSNTGSVIGGLVFVGLLLEGPPYVQRIVRQNVDLPRPTTVYDGVVSLGSLDPLPLLGYVIGELPNIRFIIFGIILILLMIYRPDGLLGHRNEPASPIDLRHERSPTSATPNPQATDGGETDE